MVSCFILYNYYHDTSILEALYNFLLNIMNIHIMNSMHICNALQHSDEIEAIVTFLYCLTCT